MDYVTRAQWGARPPKHVNAVKRSEGIFIHHSAGPESQTVREIQNYHMDANNWSDIAYSWLVDSNGTIYEGRGWGVAGGHTLNWNSISHAVCYIGNTDIWLPNEAALRAINAVVEEHAKRYGGFIKGHREVNATACPGRHLQEWINNGRPVTGEAPVTPPDLPVRPPDASKWHRAKPTLKKGSKGDEVWHLQAALRVWDSGIAVDGDFGKNTQATLKNFQKFWGLTADGIYGPQTAQALDGALALTGR